MQIYLPIAEMSIPVEAVLTLGVVVGFLSGMFGVGGGFLTTPFLMFMGISPSVAVGTQASVMVATGMSGAMGHWRRGHVDVKMAMVMLGGGFIGTLFGILIFKFLEFLGQIDFAISFLYIVLLGAVGTLMLLESSARVMQKTRTVSGEFNRFQLSPFLAGLPYKMRFAHSSLFISALVPMGIGFLSGVLSAVMGIGGGFMLVPAMIYILGMPSVLAAGTSLFQIIFMTALSTIMHATTNQNVDVFLALFLIVGSVVGAQFGVSAGRRISGTYARLFLASLILLVGAFLAAGLFVPPSEPFTLEIWR